MVAGLIERMARRFAFLSLSLLLTACGGDSLPAPHIVAQIEDQQVRYSEFETYLQENSVDSGLALASDVLSELFDQFLDEELLRRVAVERGLIAPSDTRRTAVRAVVGELEAGTIPAEQVTAYYRDHGQEFELEEGVRLRQVLVEDRATAEEVRRRMLSGTPFEEVLGDSDLSSSALWGDEGDLSSGDLPPVLLMADQQGGAETAETEPPRRRRGPRQPQPVTDSAA